jgi:spermidine synthase
LAVAAVLVPTTIDRSSAGVFEQQRSFFGVHRVKTDPSAPMLDLAHGTTLHGAEFIDPALWQTEVRYYYSGGPMGQFFARLRAARPAPQRVSVTGLGTGALACYAAPGEAWTFYEIDPVVVRIAHDTRYFHYLDKCGANTRIVLGDARLSLKAGPSHRYDILILDAFSSDAIPMHLLTKEAIELYLDQLAPSGVMLLHISNRNLEMTPMLASLARDLGLAGRHQLYLPTAAEMAESAIGSEWVVLARSQADLAFLDGEPRWGALTSERYVSAWTDDFSNIISVLKW